MHFHVYTGRVSKCRASIVIKTGNTRSIHRELLELRTLQLVTCPNRKSKFSLKTKKYNHHSYFKLKSNTFPKIKIPNLKT